MPIVEGKLHFSVPYILPPLEFVILSWMSRAASHTTKVDRIQSLVLRMVYAADCSTYPETPSLVPSLEHRKDVRAVLVVHKAQV